jgi:hypothetical protein
MTAIIEIDSRFSTIYLGHPASWIEQVQTKAAIFEALLWLSDSWNTERLEHDDPCSKRTHGQQAEQGDANEKWQTTLTTL